MFSLLLLWSMLWARASPPRRVKRRARPSWAARPPSRRNHVRRLTPAAVHSRSENVVHIVILLFLLAARGGGGGGGRGVRCGEVVRVGHRRRDERVVGELVRSAAASRGALELSPELSDLRTERFELSGRPHRDLIWTRHRGHHLLRLCHRGAQRRRWCL